MYVNVFFVLNFIFCSYYNNNYTNFLSKYTKKYLVLDNNVSDEKNNSEIPRKKKFFLFKANENNIKHSSEPWDGCDCRSDWENKKENSHLNDIIELNKINENNYKMTLLQKLQCCSTSQQEKIKIIKDNSQYFEKSQMFMCKKSLFRGLEDFEFIEFYMYDI